MGSGRCDFQRALGARLADDIRHVGNGCHWRVLSRVGERWLQATIRRVGQMGAEADQIGRTIDTDAGHQSRSGGIGLWQEKFWERGVGAVGLCGTAARQSTGHRKRAVYRAQCAGQREFSGELSSC